MFVGAQFIKVPLPFGYFNLGDCFVLLSAVLIGGRYAVAASAIGAVVADMISGYAVYAPATLIIKSVMVIAVIALLKLGNKRSNKLRPVFTIIGAVVAEVIMVCGYFIFDTVLYGFAGAAASLSGNIIQGAVSVVAGLSIMAVLERSGMMKHINIRQ